MQLYHLKKPPFRAAWASSLCLYFILQHANAGCPEQLKARFDDWRATSSCIFETRWALDLCQTGNAGLTYFRGIRGLVNNLFFDECGSTRMMEIMR